MNLKDKVILVTGGAIGIGKSTILEFAKQGANVVINYNRSEKEALELLKEVEALNIKGIIIKADVSNDKEVKKLFNTAIDTFGKVDILVNNAGYTKSGNFSELDL